MSLAAFQNTIKIVDDDVINQSWDGIDDGMWRGYFSDGTMPSKILSFLMPDQSTLLYVVVVLELWVDGFGGKTLLSKIFHTQSLLSPSWTFSFHKPKTLGRSQ